MTSDIIVSVENPTRVAVHDFWFNGMNISILDNQRKDLPLPMAKAMVAQYPFLVILTDIEGLKEEIKTVAEEIEELKQEVKDMRDTSNQVALHVPGPANMPKGFKHTTEHTCDECGQVTKGKQGLAAHKRHQHSPNGIRAFNAMRDKLIQERRYAREKEAQEQGKDDGHGDAKPEVPQEEARQGGQEESEKELLT